MKFDESSEKHENKFEDQHHAETTSWVRIKGEAEPIRF